MNTSDFCAFINDKELFSTWFMDKSLDKAKVKYYRSLMNDEIFRLNWRTSLGVTVDWSYAKEHLEGAHIVKDHGRYKSVFLDFMESKLQRGCENKPENYSIIAFNDSVGKAFFIPHEAIMNYWLAGWPRAGWNPGKYVMEPWELLKPLHDYLNGTITYRELAGYTNHEKYYAQQKVFDFAYKTIYPLIRVSRIVTTVQDETWTELLKNLYDLAIKINKDEFKAAYNPGNRFTGPLESTFPFSWFDDPEMMKNPFLQYYKEIRTEYLSGIEKTKK